MVQLDFQLWRQRMVEHLLLTAFGLSLLFHLLLLGGAELLSRLDWWRHLNLPALLKPHRSIRLQNRPLATPDPPLVFMDVSPSQASPEPPEQAKYYSAVNARAASPDPPKDSDTPKIDGAQDKLPKMTENAPPKAMPLQPAPPPRPAQQLAKAEPALKPMPRESPPTPRPDTPSVGETRPSATAAPRPTPEPHERPRTLAAARAQNPALAGEKIKQDGGARRVSVDASFDVKATSFGEYDRRFIEAVQASWYLLLDQHGGGLFRSGKVVLEFRLMHDGRIEDMKEIYSDTSGTQAWICQGAVLKPGKYDPWPSDMRRTMGADHRLVRFTFYYY